MYGMSSCNAKNVEQFFWLMNNHYYHNLFLELIGDFSLLSSGEACLLII